MDPCEQLKGLVETHFEKYPQVTINALANKSGVGATTIRRILSHSIKGDPAPHTVLNLASALTNEKRISVLISKFEGPVGKLLKDTFGPYVDHFKEHQTLGEIQKELREPIKYFIYKLAANRTGVLRKKIYQLFGQLGVEKAHDLKEKKLLRVEEDTYHATEKNFSLDYKIAAGHLPELVKFYKAEQVALGQNLFYTLSESINEEGIKEIKRIQKEAIEKIFSVFEHSKYAGDIPYFTLNLCDTLDYGREGVIQ